MKLILKLLAGIVLGVLLGLFLPDAALRPFITLKVLLGDFIGFVIPFIIIFYITHGIAGLGHQSGRIVGLTVGLTYLSTILAGSMAALVAIAVLPGFSTKMAVLDAAPSLAPYFNLEIPPVMPVMTAVLLAFLFGLGISKSHGHVLRDAVHEGKVIMDSMLGHVLIPILPLYVACIFADITANGAAVDTIKTFIIVLALAMVLHTVWLTLLYVLAGMIAGKNPLSLIKQMFPAYIAAASTMSSAATIPVTLRSVKNNGVRSYIADFGVPLCATIHLCGSMITLTSCAIAVNLISPGLPPLTFETMLPFILALGFVMIAAPGVPGGGVMAALGLLASMLGFDETALGLMIALYVAQDSLGTAANVTGDGALLVIVDKLTP
jgi:Na+/H+-dicarboxylate symporter